MDKFEINIKLDVQAASLDVVKAIAQQAVLSVQAGVGTRNFNVCIKDGRGIEHKVVSTVNGVMRWAHDEGAAKGSHGRLVRTIHED